MCAARHEQAQERHQSVLGLVRNVTVEGPIRSPLLGACVKVVRQAGHGIAGRYGTGERGEEGAAGTALEEEDRLEDGAWDALDDHLRRAK